MSHSNDPYLLHYAPDNASLIVRLWLDECGLPYQTTLVDRTLNAQNSTAYKAMNPHGLIPVLQGDGETLFETGAILLWLTDKVNHPTSGPNAPARADFLKWLFFVSNTLHADLRLLFYPSKYTGPLPAAQNALRETVRMRLSRHLDSINALVADKPDWLGNSDQPTALDYYIACLLRWVALYPRKDCKNWFALLQYPYLHRLCEGLEMRPAARIARDAEGLGPLPFSAPSYPKPPEGSPL